MRRLVLASIIITTTLTACGSVLTGPNGNQAPTASPSPSSSTDPLSRRFVEVPPNQPFKYSIVAAGLVGVGDSTGPTYNNLRVTDFSRNNGTFKLSFDNYTQPDGSFQLIVKVVASEGNPEVGGPFLAYFSNFSADGFVLRVTDVKGEVPDSMEGVRLMVEVSKYVPSS